LFDGGIFKILFVRYAGRKSCVSAKENIKNTRQLYFSSLNSATMGASVSVSADKSDFGHLDREITGYTAENTWLDFSFACMTAHRYTRVISFLIPVLMIM
jgi:hypothetical protein